MCFVDEEISNDLVYHLSDDKLKAALDIIHMIRDIVRHQHIYKVEMIQSMVNVLKLLVSELPYDSLLSTRDLRHKRMCTKSFCICCIAISRVSDKSDFMQIN